MCAVVGTSMRARHSSLCPSKFTVLSTRLARTPRRHLGSRVGIQTGLFVHMCGSVVWWWRRRQQHFTVSLSFLLWCITLCWLDEVHFGMHRFRRGGSRGRSGGAWTCTVGVGGAGRWVASRGQRRRRGVRRRVCFGERRHCRLEKLNKIKGRIRTVPTD